MQGGSILRNPPVTAAGGGWGILLLQRLEHFQGDEQGLLDAGAALRPLPFV